MLCASTEENSLPTPLLSLRQVTHSFGGTPLFEDAECSLGAGDRAALVGRNGSGKSTLLKIAAGLLAPDHGERFVQPDTRVAYVPQEPSLPSHTTVTEYLVSGLLKEHTEELHRVAAYIDILGLDGAQDVSTLSGGQQRRVVLAHTFVSEPAIMLLDEPTNHLDLPGIEWLEGALDAFRGGFVVISHDRAFLRRLTRRMIWLDRGQIRSVDRGFEHFERWAEEVADVEEKETHRLKKRLVQETVWLRQGVSARRTRNQGRLGRLFALREQVAQRITPQGVARLSAESGELSGKLVIEAKGISKAWDDEPYVKDFSIRITRGDRLGIIGPNGVGKTTLLRLLTGDLPPDEGTVRHGTRLTPVYLDQHRDQLEPDKTVTETLCTSGGDQVMVQGKARHVVGYMKDFLFDPSQARSPVSSLSGGERNRLLLAKTLAQPANLLILDEPTNDLDMETLDLLQERLAEYEGTVLLVSHDRDFLDRVVTSTLAFEDEGNLVHYAGGYSDVQRQRKQTKAEAEGSPKKSKAPKRTREKTRLSYKEERELETLSERVAELEEEVSTLEAALSNGDLYQSDPTAFQHATERVGPAREELAKAEECWLELEVLREQFSKK
jgi:ATP-binding cassette subfamily F protein uup